MEKIRLSIATTDKLGKPEYQYQHFYRAADVDALLKAALALVETSKTARIFLRSFGQNKFADRVDKAIAAVDEMLSPPRSSPPPADTGRA